MLIEVLNRLKSLSNLCKYILFIYANTIVFKFTERSSEIHILTGDTKEQQECIPWRCREDSEWARPESWYRVATKRSVLKGGNKQHSCTRGESLRGTIRRGAWIIGNLKVLGLEGEGEKRGRGKVMVKVEQAEGQAKKRLFRLILNFDFLSA